MKSIPMWVWLVAAGVGVYFLTKSSAVSAGSTAYLPTGTTLYSDAALTQSAGSTSIGSTAVVSSITGNVAQVSMNGANYYVNASNLSTATPAQISAAAAGTLT